MLSYPSDEVGNELVSLDKLDAAGVNPYSDVLSLEKYRELFGVNLHEFTGVDYVDYYASIIREAGADVEIVFANQARAILNYTDTVLTCDIHTRARTKRILKAAGAKIVLGLDDILTSSVNGYTGRKREESHSFDRSCLRPLFPPTRTRSGDCRVCCRAYPYRRK